MIYFFVKICYIQKYFIFNIIISIENLNIEVISKNKKTHQKFIK